MTVRNALFSAGFALLAASAAPAEAQQTSGTWSRAASLPGVRSELQAVSVGGKIYAIGGNVQAMKDGKPETLPDTGINQVYDPATGAWRTLAPMPKGANHTGIAELNGRIYVGGGFIGRAHMQSTDKFFVYDPTSDRWQELAPLSSPRGAPAFVALDGKIHAIGGRILNTDGAVDTHEVYDPATNKWTPAAPLPDARDHVGIGVVDGKIHVYVGRRTDAVKSKTGLHHVYDPATGKWTEAPPMPIPVSSGTYATYRGMLFYLGGECTDDDKTFALNQAFDPKTNRWLKFTDMPEGRHAQAAAVAGDRIYMIGGSTGCGAEGLLTDNLIFTLR